jgi:hypothetical protein
VEFKAGELKRAYIPSRLPVPNPRDARNYSGFCAIAHDHDLQSPVRRLAILLNKNDTGIRCTQPKCGC